MLAYVLLEFAGWDAVWFEGLTGVMNIVAMEDRGVNMKLVLNDVSQSELIMRGIRMANVPKEGFDNIHAERFYWLLSKKFLGAAASIYIRFLVRG